MSEMIRMLRVLFFFSGSLFSGFCSPLFPLAAVGRTGGGGGVAGIPAPAVIPGLSVIPDLPVCCMDCLTGCCTGTADSTGCAVCTGAEGVGVIPLLQPTNVGLGVWQFGHISR